MDMAQATEDGTGPDLPPSRRELGTGVQPEGAVRAILVVLGGELNWRCSEVPLAQDEQTP